MTPTGKTESVGLPEWDAGSRFPGISVLSSLVAVPMPLPRRETQVTSPKSSLPASFLCVPENKPHMLVCVCVKPNAHV